MGPLKLKDDVLVMPRHLTGPSLWRVMPVRGVGTCPTLPDMGSGNATPRATTLCVGVTVLLQALAGSVPALAQEDTPGDMACHTADDLAWMVGSWRQETRETIFFERWRRGNGDTLDGEAQSVSADGSEIYQDETMRIATRDGRLVYDADPDGDGSFVTFSLVSCGERRAVFENAEHDFPQRLSYHRSEEGLTASVTDLKGQGFDLDFRPDPDG